MSSRDDLNAASSTLKPRNHTTQHMSKPNFRACNLGLSGLAPDLPRNIDDHAHPGGAQWMSQRDQSPARIDWNATAKRSCSRTK